MFGGPTTQGRENAWRGTRSFTGGTVPVPGRRADGDTQEPSSSSRVRLAMAKAELAAGTPA